MNHKYQSGFNSDGKNDRKMNLNPPMQTKNDVNYYGGHRGMHGYPSMPGHQGIGDADVQIANQVPLQDKGIYPGMLSHLSQPLIYARSPQNPITPLTPMIGPQTPPLTVSQLPAYPQIIPIPQILPIYHPTPFPIYSHSINGAKYLYIKEVRYRLYEGELITNEIADEMYQQAINSEYTPGSIYPWRPNEIKLLQWAIFALLLHKKILVHQFINQSQEIWEGVASLLPHRSREECKSQWLKTQKTARLTWTKVEDDILCKLVEQKSQKMREPHNLDRIDMWREITNEMNFALHNKWVLTVKKCKERWTNVLDPSLQKSIISPQEEVLLMGHYLMYENQWTTIAKVMNRSSNWAKNNVRRLLRDYSLDYSSSFKTQEEHNIYIQGVQDCFKYLKNKLLTSHMHPNQKLYKEGSPFRVQMGEFEEGDAKEKNMEYFEIIRPTDACAKNEEVKMQDIDIQPNMQSSIQ